MPAEPVDVLASERQLWSAGYRLIAGIDEVGRGALAGPLVAAAVVLPADDAALSDSASPWARVRDSKVVVARRRAELVQWIRGNVVAWSIAEIGADELDAIGVAAANRAAMERALAGLSVEPDFLLIDAMTIDHHLPQVGLIDGDARSLSIAAASIIAKVHRDTLMIDHHQLYPDYGFDRHKGYGVASHLAALRSSGPCHLHRHTFAPVRKAALRDG